MLSDQQMSITSLSKWTSVIEMSTVARFHWISTGTDASPLPPRVVPQSSVLISEWLNFGAMTMGPDSQGRPWPLPPGDYQIHYLLADQYNSAGFVEVTVE